MSRSRSAAALARSAALLSLGALGVHQLRYLIASGAAGGEAVHRDGHAYLAVTLPVVVALATAILAAILLRGAVGWTSEGGSSRSGRRRWVLYAGALLVIFCAQELTEGAIAAGHPAGLAAIAGGGAWIAAPLALLFGAAAVLVELVLERGATALAVATEARARPGRRLRGRRRALPGLARRPLAASPLAFGLARRPPPVHSLA